MATSISYLITGANRGIGRELVSRYLARDNVHVIAAVRDVQNETSRSLTSLPAGKGSKLTLIKLDSMIPEDAELAVKELQSVHGISSLDVVIANAGTQRHFGPAATVPLEEMRFHFELNTIAPLVLFQQTWPLLQNSTQTPKFIVISSTLGSLQGHLAYPLESSAYSVSKAAINLLTRRMHAENENLIAMPICPGWTQTDLGNGNAKLNGYEGAPVPLAESVDGMVQEIDQAVRTEENRFAGYDHKDRPW